jgi:predicted RNase H-like HicB family nuclease
MKRATPKTKRKTGGNKNRNERSVENLMKLRYKIELTPLSRQDGGGFLATIPLLKGCQSDGETPDQAIQNLREAQKAWFSSALKHGDPIPTPE